MADNEKYEDSEDETFNMRIERIRLHNTMLRKIKFLEKLVLSAACEKNTVEQGFCNNYKVRDTQYLTD